MNTLENWKFLLYVTVYFPYDSATLLLDILPTEIRYKKCPLKDMRLNVYSNLIQNDPKMKIAQIPIKRRIDKL